MNEITEIQEQENIQEQKPKKGMRPWLKILINQLLIEMIFGFLSLIVFIPVLSTIAVIVWAAYIPKHKQIKYSIILSKKTFYILTFLPIITTIPLMCIPILILLMFGFDTM
jgi:hypothetical protein